MIDSIVGYHLNPWTCGIAKFNAILGRYLDVPVVGFVDCPLEKSRRPLLSVKFSEFTDEHVPLLDDWARSRARFVKVFPNEYRRALAEMAVAAQVASEAATEAEAV